MFAPVFENEDKYKELWTWIFLVVNTRNFSSYHLCEESDDRFCQMCPLLDQFNHDCVDVFYRDKKYKNLHQIYQLKYNETLVKSNA